MSDMDFSDDVRDEIVGSVSYRSDRVPTYLCYAYSKITEEYIPQFLLTVRDMYFVYGGRADTAHAKMADKTYALAADWDIIYNNRAHNIISFANRMRDYVNRELLSQYKGKVNVNVMIVDKYTTSHNGDGRLILALVDPYMPFDKTYDIADISGCHLIDPDDKLKGNYCDEYIFKNTVDIDGVKYAGAEFLISETSKLINGQRALQYQEDKKNVHELLETISQANLEIEPLLDTLQNLEVGSIITDKIIGDVDVYISLSDDLNRESKAKEDQIDLLLRSYVKLTRTKLRQRAK